MSNLYISDINKSFEDLLKARKPRIFGQPPGAVSGASGTKSVPCPLGAKCPDGGQHGEGSKRLQKHTQQAMASAQTGQPAGDESQGKATEKPGVPPGAANVGGIGSDQVKRTPPPIGDVDPADVEDITDKELDPADGTKHDDFSAKEFEKDPHGAKTRSVMQGSVPDEGKGPPPLPKKTNPANDTVAGDPTKTRPGMERQDVPNPVDPATAPPDSKPMDHYRLAQVAKDSGDEEGAAQHTELARKRSDDLSSDEHGELANQLRKEGLNDHADFHDNIHSRVKEMKGEKTDDKKPWYEMESGTPEWEEATKQRPDEHHHAHGRRLEKEHGIWHDTRTNGKKGVHDVEASDKKRKVREDYERNKASAKEKASESAKAKEVTSEKDHEQGMRDTHAETKIKANKDLEDAKKKHEETLAKIEKVKAANKQKQTDYEKAQSEYESAKADGSKKKPPKKPKLDKEEEAPEKPDLYEPESDADKLQHETHTQRAKRVADNIESHLKGNQKLSPEEKSKLERAHKMAMYHSNIGHTPTAEHKKELGDIERAAGAHAKENHADVQAKEDQKNTQQAKKQAESDQKQKAKIEGQQAKTEAQAAKDQAKKDAGMPKMPQSDLDHAKMQDHKAKAQKIRANIESQAQNPALTPEEKEKHQRILSTLEKHEKLEHVPGTDHVSELKELEKLSGEHGKKPFSPEDASEENAAPPPEGKDTGGPNAMQMVHTAQGLGQALAASATSPYGAAGGIATQTINYGVTGATAVGHRLLHDTEEANRKVDEEADSLDKKEAERNKKAAREAEQVGPEGSKVLGRGNT